MTNRPSTPLLPQFLEPIAKSTSTRAKVFGVLLAFLTVMVGFSAVATVRAFLDSRVTGERAVIAFLLRNGRLAG